MRTTIDLPEKLVEEALQVSHHRTKTSVIIEALEDLVRKHQVRQIRNYKGRLDLGVDLDATRKRR